MGRQTRGGERAATKRLVGRCKRRERWKDRDSCLCEAVSQYLGGEDRGAERRTESELRRLAERREKAVRRTRGERNRKERGEALPKLGERQRPVKTPGGEKERRKTRERREKQEVAASREEREERRQRATEEGRGTSRRKRQCELEHFGNNFGQGKGETFGKFRNCQNYLYISVCVCE